MHNKISLNSKRFKAFLATLFLGALNDNAFKVMISLLAVKVILDPSQASKIISLAGGVFILPFLLFSAYAGYLADRFSKKTIMVWAKFLEIVVMYLGFIAFSRENIPFLLIILFFMGAQSTLFGPSKYGILPEMFSDEDLTRANGYLQMWTFMAIILGTASSGAILKFCRGNAAGTGLFFVGIAAAGFLMSFFIPNVPGAGSSKPFEINFLKDIKNTFREVKKAEPVFLCMLGIVYFWLLGVLFEMNIIIYAKHFMHLPENQISYLLGTLALGMGIGGILAGRLSGQKVEFGLVPLGALGMGVFSLFLAFSYHSPFLTGLILLALGINSGLFVIPLNAYIQQKSPKDALGKILALENFMSSAGMILAAGLYYLFTQGLKLEAPTIFLILSVFSFIVITYIVKRLPDFLLRFLAWLLTHSIYNIRIVGQEHVPKEGGALLVCNHLSFVDAFLISACIQRFIRFVMYRKYYEMKTINPFCRLMKAIPIATEDGPKEMIRSIRTAREFLNEGELVCIFAEGEITRTGQMLSFKKGLEAISKGSKAPIIPVYLDRVWGSIMSFYKGKYFKKIPVRVPYPVTVAFGPPLPPSSDTSTVRQAVAELGAEAFKYRKNDQELLSTRFYIQAKKSPFKACMTDSQGTCLNYWQALVASMSFSKVLARKYPHEQYLGLLLPPSVGAGLANIAVSITGKVPVNLNYTASSGAIKTAIEKCRMKHILTSYAFIEKIGLKQEENMVFLEEIKKEIKVRDKILSFLGFWFLPHRILRLLYRAERGRNINSPATVIFTSGSTGDPKGVVLSHANINANIEGLYQVLAIRPKDTVMGVLPFFHSFGYTGTLWYPLTTGMSVVYHYNPLDAQKIGELVKKHQATMFMITPTFLLSYIRRCTKEEFASLRLVVAGAEKLKERIRQAFYEKFGLNPLEGYGCTELSPVVSLNIPDYDSENISQAGTKIGSIGHPLPGVVARIVDPETFEELPCGREGLLLIKGANVMLGYLNDQEATARVIRNGWYITGDIACLDEDGFIILKDRLSRFSKIGGEMVSHFKIEEELHNILNKKDEQLFAVASIPDEKKGEAIAVLYKNDPHINIDELYESLNATDLPKLWIPKKANFYPVETIPILGSGKPDLKQINEIARERSESLP